MEQGTGWTDIDGALQVRLTIFEGPLDLLLHLIKQSKIDIYDIPIAQITGQYLEYLDLMKDLNLDIASEFMVMSATLMHIKSRMLLPVHQDAEEDEDPRVELVQQLLEYQRYKEASENLREMLSRRSLLHPRQEDGKVVPTESVFIDASLFQLLKVFRDVLSTAVEGPAMVVSADRWSVVDRMRDIVEKLAEHGSISFRGLFGPGVTRGEVVASLLAVLELVRMHQLHLAQLEPGGEILLARLP